LTWRRVAVIAAWIASAGWGIYYLVVLAASSSVYVAEAVAHFITGYLFGRAIMTNPMTVTTAMLGTLAAGAYTRAALAAPVEAIFAPLGPIAAIALADTSSPRNIALSVVAFALGFLLLIWLSV
jgi:hypothetical protein